MKAATLVRAQSTTQGTPGAIIFGAEAIQCLELPWFNNARKVSCIPVGSYDCRWLRSPRFGMCYHVCDVPERSSILIHSANFAGSEADGWFTQLQGCIAPATRFGYMKNPQGKMQLAGLISRPAVAKLEEFMEHETFILTVRNA